MVDVQVMVVEVFTWVAGGVIRYICVMYMLFTYSCFLEIKLLFRLRVEKDCR